VKKFGLYVALAVLATLPGVILRLTGFHGAPLVGTLIFGVAILGAGFLLSWGAEAAEGHVSQGLAIAALALITVLPEYAVDIYYTWQAGHHPGSPYVGYAAANMTGANRLLIGTAWPLIALLYWWRSGKRAVPLVWENAAEVAYLAVASLYSFVITLKGRIDLVDMVVLLAIFGAYVWRVSKLPKREGDDDDDDDEAEPGPAAALEQLPPARQRLVIGALAVVAAAAILLVAAPFAEALVRTGADLHINQVLLIQWIAPLAGEAPELVITVLFTLALRPTAALGALVSDKINQWTLLVGMIPLVYSLAAGHVAALPLDARQHEEFFLTAAQSLFAVALLLRLRLSLLSGVVLLALFVVQLGLGVAYRADEAALIRSLTAMAWGYMALAALVLLWNRRFLLRYVAVGLLNRPTPPAATTVEDDDVADGRRGESAATGR